MSVVQQEIFLPAARLVRRLYGLPHPVDIINRRIRGLTFLSMDL